MNIKLLFPLGFAFMFSVLNAQTPVKTSLKPFNLNPQESTVKKRSLESDLPQFVVDLRWDDDNDDWDYKNADTTLNKYSNNGWLIEQEERRTWGQNKSVFTYDGAGRELTRFSFDKNTNGGWDTSSLNTAIYDANGLTIKMTDKYNWSGSYWSDSSIQRFTNSVDSKGRITEQIQERWNMSNGYDYETKTIYSYGADDKIDRLELQAWNDTFDTFFPMVIYDSIVWYQYVENDAFLDKSKPLYVSGIQLNPEGKIETTIVWTYDKLDNVLSQMFTTTNADGESELERDLYEYKYDAEGRCVESLEFDYDDIEKDYFPDRKTIYAKFYTAPNLAIDALIPNEKVYPNPAVNRVYFTEKVIKLDILNMQGQRQLSADFLQAKTPLDVSSLTAGTYIIRYINQQGMMRSSQLLIQ